MPEDTAKSSVQEVLSRAGFASNLIHKVRFRGPVGKLALLGVVSVSGLGGVGIRTSNPSVEGLCAVLATVVTLFVAAGIVWYSHEHPDQATLEGMEVVVMQQQKAWAAKGFTGPHPQGLIVPDPDGLPPKLNPSLDPDE